MMVLVYLYQNQRKWIRFVSRKQRLLDMNTNQTLPVSDTLTLQCLRAELRDSVQPITTIMQMSFTGLELSRTQITFE